MNVITVSQAESNLQNVIDQIINDVEPTIITTNTGDSVVMLPLDEFNAWQETRYLLSTPANAKQLIQTIAEDETDYLLGTEANRKRLLEAVESMKTRNNYGTHSL